MWAWHLCWSLSVKSSVVGCLSNTVHKMFRNCWERTLNIAVMKHLWNDTFEKSFIITATEVVLVWLFSYTVVPKQNNKNENTEYYGTFISFKTHLYSKQRTPIFLFFDWWSIVLHLHVWVKSKFFLYFQSANLSRHSTFAWKR